MKRYRRYPKLTAVCDNGSHLISGVALATGPGNDAPDFEPAVRQAARHLPLRRVLADAAYDAEAFHELCREELGVRTTAIPINTRGRPGVEPTTRYRRLMHRCFPRKVYGQRWQVESVFSRLKRCLGSALTARSTRRRQQECLLRVLTYDLMILASC